MYVFVGKRLSQRHISEHDLSLEKGLLEQTLKEEQKARAALSDEAFSMHNALKHSKKAGDQHAAEIAELRKTLDALRAEMPPLGQVISSNCRQFEYKEMSLCRGIAEHSETLLSISSAALERPDVDVIVESISPFSKGGLQFLQIPS